MGIDDGSIDIMFVDIVHSFPMSLLLLELMLLLSLLLPSSNNTNAMGCR